MLAILDFLNVHNLPIFQPILMILVSKFMVHRALSDKLYLSLGLLSPLSLHLHLYFVYVSGKGSVFVLACLCLLLCCLKMQLQCISTKISWVGSYVST